MFKHYKYITFVNLMHSCKIKVFIKKKNCTIVYIMSFSKLDFRHLVYFHMLCEFHCIFSFSCLAAVTLEFIWE